MGYEPPVKLHLILEINPDFLLQRQIIVLTSSRDKRPVKIIAIKACQNKGFILLNYLKKSVNGVLFVFFVENFHSGLNIGSWRVVKRLYILRDDISICD